MNDELITRILAGVPDYQVFLSVDELAANTEKLVEAYPEIAGLQTIGHSRQGDPITAVTIGTGSKKALLFAFPHPNEPIGSMTLEYLLEQLVADEQLRDDFDYTWTIIKCADPDGARLNEDWFKGPFTATNYARHFYRPPSHLQVEWTFPYDYKNLHYATPLPETEALMQIIEQIQPDFIYSLHNSGFGGVYLYMSGKIPGFTEPFYELVADQELPLNLGEPEMPMVTEISPAIYNLPGTQEMYDFLEQYGDLEPAEVLGHGSSSFEYAKKFCSPSTLICEMPYWYSPSVNDRSPSDMIRKEAVLQNVADLRRYWAEIGQIFEPARLHLTAVNPFEQALDKFMEQSLGSLIALETYANIDPKFQRVATVAEKFDNFSLSRFYNLLSTGMLVRMIETQLQLTPNVPALEEQYAKAAQKFEEDTTQFESSTAYEQIPIQKLVRVQLGTALLNMSLL